MKRNVAFTWTVKQGTKMPGNRTMRDIEDELLSFLPTILHDIDADLTMEVIRVEDSE